MSIPSLKVEGPRDFDRETGSTDTSRHEETRSEVSFSQLKPLASQKKHSVKGNEKPSVKGNVKGNDYDFDVTLEGIQGKENHHKKVEAKELKRAADLAEILLDTKRTFKAENNILDNEQTTDASGNRLEDVPSIGKISRATIIRCEKVKTMFNFKYLLIDHIYENQDQAQYPGIDDVYNPLQIIRNRRLRAKYHEYPKQLSVKTLPLASNVFSSRKSNPKKPWKLIWAVELNELIADSSWRIHHIHELKGPKGELWFPPPPVSSSASYESSSRGSRIRDSDYLHSNTHLRKRLHDKIFTEEEDGDDGEVSTTRKVADKVKLGPKKHGHSDVSSTNTSESDFEPSVSYSPKSPKKESIRPPKESPLSHNSSNSKPASDYFTQKSTLVSPSSETDEDKNIQGVQFKPLEAKRVTADDLMVSENVTIDNNNNTVNIDSTLNNSPNKDNDINFNHKSEANPKDRLIQHHLFEAYGDLDEFSRATDMKLNFLINLYPKLSKLAANKVDHLSKSEIPHLKQFIVDINDDSIPSYELLCSTLLNEVKSLLRIINDDYSLKIDNLLSNSDRIFGEINTSMSLELRKVDERLDRLNTSLFGTLSTGGNNNDNPKLRITESTNYRTMYWMLENSIVIVLRLVWVIANIYKFIMLILRVIWKVIRFILF